VVWCGVEEGEVGAAVAVVVVCCPVWRAEKREVGDAEPCWSGGRVGRDGGPSLGIVLLEWFVPGGLADGGFRLRSRPVPGSWQIPSVQVTQGH